MTDRRRAWAVAGGLLLLYLVWGSTYLAAKHALETLPPFLSAGSRFLGCGLGMYAAARLAGVPRPTRRQWRNAAGAGVLLFVGGNGGVTYAQSLLVPSGVTALVVATTPAWLAVFDWLGATGRRPGAAEFAGIGIGLAGVGALTLAGTDAGGLHPTGGVVIVFASAAWAAGGLFARGADVPSSAVALTGMEMVVGGVGLLAASWSTGEMAAFRLSDVTVRSGRGFAFLCVAGVVALPVFSWLMRNARPALVGTYAFVNPVVAVLLGWAVEGEHISPVTGTAAALVVAGVVLITVGKRATPVPRSDEA